MHVADWTVQGTHSRVGVYLNQAKRGLVAPKNSQISMLLVFSMSGFDIYEDYLLSFSDSKFGATTH